MGVWVGASTAVALAVFAISAFFAVLYMESDEPSESPAEEAAETTGDVLKEVLLAMAVAAPVGLGLAVGGAVWISRRALKPVDDVIAAARGMTVAHLDRRLPAPPGDDELARLVLTLNQLFERLERGQADLARFADDASHELRTPLSVVASELEIALRRPRTVAEWEATARTSLDEVQRLGRLVAAMLRLARADASSLSLERLDVTALIEAASEREGDAVVVTRVGAEPVWIDGDGEALSVALSNLLDNAVRYAPPGGRVTIGVERRAGEVLIHVDDTGPGVPPSARDAIFAPYARGAGAPGDGAGLGLAIARRIAEQHHGSLCAGDAPDGGARFTLGLPAAAEAGVA